jgi:AcrR family transcriptional regulator
MSQKMQLSPRKMPSQKRSRETVAAIYQAAAQVFSTNGYADTTTEHIAERAGVSIGTLYQYFPSKEAISLGLWEKHVKEITDAAQKISQDIRQRGSIDRSITPYLIRMSLEHNFYDRAQHKMFIGNINWPEAIIQKRREHGLTIKKDIEGILSFSANVRIKNYKIAAHIIWETVNDLVHDYILYWDDQIDQEVFINELADMLNCYIFSDNA